MKTRILFLALCASALTPLSGSLAQSGQGDHASSETDLLFPVRVDGKWGVVDTKGDFVIPAQYRWADVWSNGLVRVQDDNHKTVILNLEGETVIPSKFSFIRDFGSRDFTIARLDNNDVVIDRAGNVVLGPGFQTLDVFDGNRTWIVGDGRSKGLVTLDCEWLLEPEYSQIYGVQDTGLAYAKPAKGGAGLLKADGTWAAEPGKRFEDVGPLSRAGVMPAKQNGKWGLVDSNLQWVVQPIDNQPYGYPGIYTDPTQAVVAIDGKYGVVDLSGAMIIPAIHDNVFGGSGAAFTAKKDGKFGAYDRAGKQIVPFEYDSISAFSASGIAWVNKDGRRFAIDLTGNEVAPREKPPGIERVEYFNSEGWAAAKRDGKWGAVNEAGEWVLEPKFECVEMCRDELAPPPPAPMMAPPYRPLAKDAVKKPRKQEWCRIDD